MFTLRKAGVRRGLLAALVSVALLGSAYAAWPLWSLALARALAPEGIGIDELVIDFGTRQLTIERFALTQRSDTYALRVTGRGVMLRYRWRELWQGRLDMLHASAIAIAVKPLPRTSSAPTTSASIALEPPSVLLARLPVAAITLPLVSIDAELAAGTQHFSGSMDYIDDVLQLQFSDSSKPQLSVQLRADRQDQLELTVQREQILLAQLSNRIESPRRLRGEVKVQLEPLSAVLQDWGWLGRASAYSGELSATWLGPLPAAIDAAAWRSIALTGEIAAHIAAGDSARQGEINLRAEYVCAQGVVTANLKQVTGSGTLPAPAMLAERLALSAAQHLKIDVRAADSAALRITLEPLRLELSGAVFATVAAPQQVDALQHIAAPQQIVHGALTLTDSVIARDTDWHLDTNYQAQLTLPRFKQAGYRAQQVHLQLAGRVAGTRAQGIVRIAPGPLLAVKSNRWSGGSTGPVNVRSGAPIEIAFTPDRLLLPAAQLNVGRIAITQSDNNYHFNAAQLTLRDGTVDPHAIDAASAQMKLHLSGLSAPIGSYRIQPVDVRADLTLAQRRLRGDWSVRAANDLFTVRGNLQHSLADGRGEATATLPPLIFKEDGRYLPALFAAWPHPVDVSGGQLGFKARAQWRPRDLSAQLDLDLREVSGFYRLNLFKGLSTRLHANYAHGVLQVPATPVTLTELDAGVALQQLAFTAAIEAADMVRVRDLRAQLLGGRMYQNEFTYRWRATDNTIPLLIEGVQLNQLLTLEQNIEGSGTLDGRLPVTLSAQGIAVQNGSFQARAPGGVIRYKGKLPQSALAAVPELQLALDSLQNFHYTRLNVSADYAPSGDLLLRTELHGRNPELTEARPLHFNLNIRENIPDLLRGIQLSRDISDSIEKRIQDFYQHQSQESAR